MNRNNLVVLNDNQEPTTDSLKVAKAFGKQHGHVMESIKGTLITMDEFLGGDRSIFRLISYTDSMNREKPCYEMDRKGFMILVMGFTGTKALKFKQDFVIGLR